MPSITVNLDLPMSPRKKRTYARHTLEAISLLGKMVRLGRKTRKMTEHEMAERLGIARATLQRMEQGDPKVEIGLMLEAATLLGIKLFDADANQLTMLASRTDDRIALLPKHIYKTSQPVKDDF